MWGSTEGNHLLRGGNLLSLEDPPLGLADYLLQQADRPGKLFGQDLAGKELGHALALMIEKLGDCRQGILPDLAGVDEQIAVRVLADFILLGVENDQHPLLDHPPMVAVVIAGSRRKLFAFGQPAGNDPNPVGKQRRVGGMVDVGFHRCGIDAHLAAGFDLGLFGVVDDLPVNCLPGLFPQGRDVFLEDRLAGILSHLQAGEAAEGVRVFKI